jgi:hypothetical protein
MCGLFGVVGRGLVPSGAIAALAKDASRRGRDAWGLCYAKSGEYFVERGAGPATRPVARKSKRFEEFVIGHSRLMTSGYADNQPVVRNGVVVIHNGIVVNADELWKDEDSERTLEVDTEIIAAIASRNLEEEMFDAMQAGQSVLDLCKGTVSAAIAFPAKGKMCLVSNNGSLFVGKKGTQTYFASEKVTLSRLNVDELRQIYGVEAIEIPTSNDEIQVTEYGSTFHNLLPSLGTSTDEESLLEWSDPDLRRCSKCILPSTMPFIEFDVDGVCNYCAEYEPRNSPRSANEFLELLQPYRRMRGPECIVPFSGGRDSSFALHVMTEEFGIRPITYTYDWGMVTDLARRNISRMCGQLGVENILVAADVSRKRRNIARNLEAWLRSPHLGMLSILTAGDKHFFRHVESVKERTGIALNIWAVNPLEVTHFKAGFLGIPPDFREKRVYSHGAGKQIRYHMKRTEAMLKSPRYFNDSLVDTLSGEFYRSFRKKRDYFHFFDFHQWDESEIDSSLAAYDWEKAPDSSSTWRIGDGTAAFYNYVYFTVAGFTEHDTFRSNQIREGQLDRESALALVKDENRPRYPNIKWYLDTLGFDFERVIRTVNSMPRLTTLA